MHQLTRNLTEDQIEKSGFAPYFVDHTAGVYPTAASGSPWNASSMAVKGDTIADLNEDLAAEQKARVTYDNILRLVDDPDIIEPIKFLREREIVHYQRFGDALPQSCKIFVFLWSKVCALLHIFHFANFSNAFLYFSSTSFATISIFSSSDNSSKFSGLLLSIFSPFRTLYLN